MLSSSFLLKRSGSAHNRPDSSILQEGEIVLNYNNNSPGLFLKNSSSELVKIGPVEVSSSAPNISNVGEEGNSLGELWFDLNSSKLKVWTGSDWESCWAAPPQPLVGRMYWNGNTTSTSVDNSDTYYSLSSSSRTLDPVGAGFSLSVDYPGLTYNNSENVYVQVIMSGCHNGSATDTFKFALAHVDQGTTTTFPDDVVASSIVRNKRDTHGGFYTTEALLQLNSGDTILPVIMCEGESENSTVQSLSMTIRAI